MPGTSTQGNPDKGNSQNRNSHSNDQSKPSGVTQPSWADRVSTVSTPFHSHNRFSALSTGTDGDQSDQPYTEQQTRKYRRNTKRKLESTSSPSNDQQQPSKGSTQNRTQRAVYGRSSVNTTGIVAANKLIKKAVYCIDNIDVLFNVEDIFHYVTSQGISVVSCLRNQTACSTL